jgi:hypothetical protein
MTDGACAPQPPDPANHQRLPDMFENRDENAHRETAPDAQKAACASAR